MKGVVHIPLEATHLRGRDYAVRPAGAVGTCGFSPVPWTVQYIKAGSPDEAWNAYVNQCALVNAEWLRGWKDGQVEVKQSEVDHQVDFHYHRLGRD